MGTPGHLLIGKCSKKCIFGEECEKLQLRREIVDVDERRAYIIQSYGGPYNIYIEISHQIIAHGCHRTFSNLVLKEKLRKAVRFVCDREKEGVLQPDELY